MLVFAPKGSENPTLPLSRGAGGGAGIGEEDPREVAPMPFVL